MGIVVTNGTVLNNIRMTAGNIPVASSASTGVVTSSLWLYYDASNISSYPGSGSTVYDLSVNNRRGTLTAASMYTSSIASGIFSFNGINQIISTTVTPPNTWSLQMAINNTFSYSAEWNRGIFSSYGQSNYYGIYVGTQLNQGSGNGMHMWTDGNTFYSIGTSTSFAINTWYIFTMVSTGSQVKIYLNGNTTPITTVNTATTNAGTLSIGQSRFDFNYWKGYIANTLVYSKALTTAEITQNYNALKGRFGLT
jgi:hypothetical protein